MKVDYHGNIQYELLKSMKLLKIQVTLNLLRNSIHVVLHQKSWTDDGVLSGRTT